MIVTVTEESTGIQLSTIQLETKSESARHLLATSRMENATKTEDSALENTDIRVAIARRWHSHQASPGNIRATVLQTVVDALAVIAITVFDGFT